MALKDWKKLAAGNGRVSWYNKKSNSVMTVKKAKKGAVFITQLWDPDAMPDGSVHIFFTSRFKTKSQALAYAKSYMRKH